MACWLLKTEPTAYSFARLARDRRTVWDGIRNAQALLNLRAMRRGDEALVYHSGAERAIVGLAAVVSDPYPDPKLDDPRRVVVDLAVVGPVPRPVTLAAIKAEPALRDLALVRNSRLSVVPVPAKLRARLWAMAELAR